YVVGGRQQGRGPAAGAEVPAPSADQASGVVKTVQSGDAAYTLRGDGQLLLNGASLNTEVKRIAAAPGGAVYVLNVGGQLRAYSAANGWVGLSTEVKDLAGGPDGAVYVLKDAGDLHSYKIPAMWVSRNADWVDLGTDVKEIGAADSQGSLYLLDRVWAL